jgi:hypothetical protein
MWSGANVDSNSDYVWRSLAALDSDPIVTILLASIEARMIFVLAFN